MVRAWMIVKEQDGVALWRCPQGWTCTRINRDRGQVYDAMPGDAPDAGSWCARICAAGVDYVSRPYSRSHARRIFREYVRAAAEERELMDLAARGAAMSDPI